MKTYVTFGQDHVHSINGKTFDKDCVAVIEAPTAAEGRQRAMEAFNGVFCFSYPEDRWEEHQQMVYFRRGYLELENL